MGLMMPYELTCGCGNVFEVKRYEYVFTDDFPEVRETILNGEFYVETCPKCGRMVNVENRFLYRDERNRLWIWVCAPEERRLRRKLKEQLLDGDAPIVARDVYGVEYRKFLVFGRDELLDLLFRKDGALRDGESGPLKENAAIKLFSPDPETPGCLFLNGDKVKMISLPLRRSRYYRERMKISDGGRRWLDYYAVGVNLHNPFSSLLSGEQIARWKRIRKESPVRQLADEYEDFAESYAACRTDAQRFRKSDPARWAFLEEARKMRVSRKIISCTA